MSHRLFLKATKSFTTFGDGSFKWMVPKIGLPQNGWFTMKNPIKWMILGYPYFWKHPNLEPFWNCESWGGNNLAIFVHRRGGWQPLAEGPLPLCQAGLRAGKKSKTRWICTAQIVFFRKSSAFVGVQNRFMWENSWKRSENIDNCMHSNYVFKHDIEDESRMKVKTI